MLNYKNKTHLFWHLIFSWVQVKFSSKRLVCLVLLELIETTHFVVSPKLPGSDAVKGSYRVTAQTGVIGATGVIHVKEKGFVVSRHG